MKKYDEAIDNLDEYKAKLIGCLYELQSNIGCKNIYIDDITDCEESETDRISNTCIILRIWKQSASMWGHSAYGNIYTSTYFQDIQTAIENTKPDVVKIMKALGVDDYSYSIFTQVSNG